MGGTRVERYLDHLDGLTGGVEPRFVPVPSTHEGLKNVDPFDVGRPPAA